MKSLEALQEIWEQANNWLQDCDCYPNSPTYAKYERKRKTIEKELKEKDYIQKALDKIVDHCEIGFGGGKDEDGNWVICLMFPNQQDITILCKDKEEYDFWVKYADM